MIKSSFSLVAKKESVRTETTNRWLPIVTRLIWIGFILHCLCILILSSVPPVSRDALTHHLTIPKMYLQHGGIYEIPSMFFSYFPMNVDLLYMLPIYFKFDIAAKYIHFLFALMTAGLIFLYLKKVLNRVYGMLGALLFLTIPIIIKLSITVYVDLGLIFFSWACLYYFIKWEAAEFRPRYLVISGLFCGLALGTKYNGLITLLIMAVLVPISFSQKKNKRLPKKDKKRRYFNSIQGLIWAMGFVFIALVIFSPWMIRNTVWKGNPFYPLFNNVFNPPEKSISNDLPKNNKQPHNAFWYRRYIYGESFAQTLSIPIRAFFQGQDNNPKYFDGKLNPCLLLLPIMAFFPMKDERLKMLAHHRKIFIAFSSLFILFVFFRADFRIRYMAPAIPPLVCLTVFGMRNLVQTVSQKKHFAKKAGWLLVGVTTLFMFVYNGAYIYSQFTYVQPFDYLTGKVDRDGYISRYRNEHAAIVQANKILPKDAEVLCLFLGNRIYYLDRSAHFAKDFHLEKNGGYTEDALRASLMRYKTTHVLIDKNNFFNWIQYRSPEVRNIFAIVLNKYTRLLFEINGIRLLEIRSSD
ncbi:phospholipid carrier-dependent glycosyltransferase [uncultured Desulfosarcina sp.]|uniref:ArnT family glycosyltransferase n=1 Tax=uncultured Desulfosarcina sp. TaxID=218289 RepID=UPI0029C7307C|nr:glycosyltransferase family 39 protein [uncultured Desulfosarcina sp.]